MRSGPKAFSRALLGGVFAVTVLYLLTNAVLFYSLGFEAVARSKTVAADLAQKTLGEAGAWLVSAFVIVAALATMNATIVTGARSGYALGCDYERLSFLGRWRAETGTPAAALLTQAALSLALVSFGAVTRQGFVTMVELTTPVFWLFLLLVGTALLVLRQKDAGARRPFPVPFYPLTPLLFCGSAAYMLFASVAHAGVGALVGLAVLGLGVPALRVARRRPYARGEV
jgi:amino acid transporter